MGKKVIKLNENGLKQYVKKVLMENMRFEQDNLYRQEFTPQEEKWSTIYIVYVYGNDLYIVPSQSSYGKGFNSKTNGLVTLGGKAYGKPVAEIMVGPNIEEGYDVKWKFIKDTHAVPSKEINSALHAQLWSELMEFYEKKGLFDQLNEGIEEELASADTNGDYFSPYQPTNTSQNSRIAVIPTHSKNKREFANGIQPAQPNRDATLHHGSGVYMCSPDARRYLNGGYGNTVIYVNIDKLKSKGINVREYKSKFGGFMYVAEYVPADCIIDIDTSDELPITKIRKSPLAENKKKLVKLKESDLRKIVKEAVDTVAGRRFPQDFTEYSENSVDFGDHFVSFCCREGNGEIPNDSGEDYWIWDVSVSTENGKKLSGHAFQRGTDSAKWTFYEIYERLCKNLGIQPCSM